MMEWYLPEEKLPTIEGVQEKVIITIDPLNNKKRFAVDAWTNGESFYGFIDGKRIDYSYFTVAWMPYPKPYEK